MFSINIKKVRKFRLQFLVILLLFIIFLGILGLSYFFEKNITVNNLEVTNVTDSSATISFTTNELSNPSIIVSENNDFNILNQLSKPKFTDDRDNTYRYTHHITVTGLSAESKYYYRITTGLKDVDIKYPTLETGSVLNSIITPDPTYAKLPDDIPTDSIIYLSLGDESSQILSTILNDNNAFTFDKSNFKTKDLINYSQYKQGDYLTFEIVNNSGIYTFSGRVGNDEPVTPILISKTSSSVLGIETVSVDPSPFPFYVPTPSNPIIQYQQTTTSPANSPAPVIQYQQTTTSPANSPAPVIQYQQTTTSPVNPPAPAQNNNQSPSPTQGISGGCSNGSSKCNGNDQMQCLGGNWYKVGTGCGEPKTQIPQPVSESSLKSTDLSSCNGLPQEAMTACQNNQKTIANETSSTAVAIKSSEPSSCDSIPIDAVKQACLGLNKGNNSAINNSSNLSSSNSVNYSDCAQVVNPVDKYICLQGVKVLPTVPDSNVCVSSGSFCNGSTLVNCATKQVVGSTSGCGGNGCCVNPSGSDSCGLCKVTTPTTDVCSSYVTDFNASNLTSCCANNPNSPICKSKVGTSLGVYNQYDPKITSTYGFGYNSCGLVAFSSGLAELGVSDFYSTMDNLSKEQSQIKYNPQNGIQYENLVKVSQDVCKQYGCSVGSFDYQNSTDYLNGIKANIDQGRQVVTLFAYRDNGKGTVPVDSTGTTSDNNHYARITNYDTVANTITIAETVNPGVNGRPIEITVPIPQFIKSVHLMKGTSYWTEVIAKDKSIDNEINTNKKNNDVGIRQVDTPPNQSLLDNRIITSVNAQSSNTNPSDFTYQLDTTGLYNITSVNGYNVYTKEVKILDQSDLKLKFFYDLNGDGVREPNEEYINTPLDVKLEKVSEIKKIDLKAGWNLINMNIVNDSIKTASDLLIEIARQGGYATHVSTIRNGKWILFTERAGVPYGTDFNLVPTEGYFVKVYKPVSLLTEGKFITANTPIYLNTGWNLVGFKTANTENASTIIDNINKNTGVTVDTVTNYDNGRYSNLVKSNGTTYGQDFIIDDSKGYFVRAYKGGQTINSY